MGRYQHRSSKNKRGWGAVDWIYLAQDRDKWLALLNMATNSGSVICGEID
jgi:hypothetical protein